jgi:hypothetical protein
VRNGARKKLKKKFFALKSRLFNWKMTKNNSKKFLQGAKDEPKEK